MIARVETMGMCAVGGYLATLRSAAGLSQEGLARRLDIASKTVSVWETAKQTPSADILARALQILGGNPADVQRLFIEGETVEDGRRTAEAWLMARTSPEDMATLANAKARPDADRIAAELEELARRIRG